MATERIAHVFTPACQWTHLWTEKKIPSLKIRRRKNISAHSHIKTWFTFHGNNMFLHRLSFVNYLYNLLKMLQPMSGMSTKLFCVCSHLYKELQSLQHPTFKSCSGPARAIQLHHQAICQQKNSETVTIHVQLYWKCRTVKVPYKVLWFFLSKYIKNVHPVIQSHTHKKHITVLRQYQFQLLFEQELEQRH